MKDAMYRPSLTDMSQLMGVMKHPGYEVLKRIFESEIDQLQLDMLNADPMNEKEVLTKHNLALAGGMFYQRVLNRIAGEAERFNGTQERGKVMNDPTEALFQ